MYDVMVLAAGFTSDPLNLTLTILGIIALVGSAVAVGRSALFKAQLETLRDNNTDLTNRVEILEHEKDILKHDNELLGRDLREEKRAREIIEKVVTSQQEIQALSLLAEGIRTDVAEIKARVVI